MGPWDREQTREKLCTKNPLTSIKTGTQKHKACGACTTTKKKGKTHATTAHPAGTADVKRGQERQAAPSYILSQSWSDRETSCRKKTAADVKRGQER